MADGHTFTTRAVRRIRESVKWTEGQATDLARPPRQGQKAPQDWQGVYEVQSVDTGAETCTVERYITSGSTGSATWTCNYDTSNEPSEGDLGTVLRQGNGSLFFFSKTGGCSLLTPENSRLIQEVGSQSNVAFKETYDSGSSTWSTDYDALMAWKFNSTVSVGASQQITAWWHTDHAWNLIVRGSEGSTYLKQVGATFVLKVITEDFTLATIDRSGLESVSGVEGETRASFNDAEDEFSLYECDALGGDYSMAIATGSETVYGFAMYLKEFTEFGNTWADNDYRRAYCGSVSEKSDINAVITSA